MASVASLALDGEKSEELRQIARVGLDGVGGGATLGAQHVEKQRKLDESLSRSVRPRFRPFRAGPMRIERLEAETARLGVETDPLQRTNGIAERDQVRALGAVGSEHRGGEQHGAPDLAGIAACFKLVSAPVSGRSPSVGCGVLLASSQSGIGTS